MNIRNLRPKREEILRHCRYLLRKLRYEEMTQSDYIKAMEYLRTNIAEVIDHDNVEQLQNVNYHIVTCFYYYF